MSKFSNILKMIILLKSRNKMKVKEIAEELGVDERMVRKYKVDLELAGVYIDSTKGSYGGYSLRDYDYLLNVDVKEEEYSALNLANIELRNNNFIYSDEIKSLTDKLAAIKKSQSKYEIVEEYYIQTNMSTSNEEDKKKVLDVHAAIIAKNKINIKYFSLTSGESVRVIHPYALINYKNSLYVVAYCERRNEIREFKISRISEYEIIKDKFVLPREFSAKKFMSNNLGIYKDGTLHIKLLIFNPMSYIISEKIWVDNQNIVWNEDKSIIFEATMEGKTEIISWVLSMGKSVKVIEPEELKISIKEEINNMIQYY